jgi:hypothetical protein
VGLSPKERSRREPACCIPRKPAGTCLSVHRYSYIWEHLASLIVQQLARGGNAGVVLAYLGGLRTPATRLSFSSTSSTQLCTALLFRTTIHTAYVGIGLLLACAAVLPCFRAGPCWLFATPFPGLMQEISCRRVLVRVYLYGSTLSDNLASAT